jgi:hypothetical protein
MARSATRNATGNEADLGEADRRDADLRIDPAATGRRERLFIELPGV